MSPRNVVEYQQFRLNNWLHTFRLVLTLDPSLTGYSDPYKCTFDLSLLVHGDSQSIHTYLVNKQEVYAKLRTRTLRADGQKSKLALHHLGPIKTQIWKAYTSQDIIYVKFTSGIKNISFVFLPIHRCVLALYTQYFPESCEKISQACDSGGIRTHDPCNSRAVSYQLDYRGCPVARGSSNPKSQDVYKMKSMYQTKSQVCKAGLCRRGRSRLPKADPSP